MSLYILFNKTILLWFFVLAAFYSICLSQNFIYNPDDWTAFTEVQTINSISENDRFVMFGTNNGVHSFNKDSEKFFYDYGFNHNLPSANIHHILYDEYRDYIWIVHDLGVSYKSIIGHTYNNLDFFELGLVNYRDIVNIGIDFSYFWVSTTTSDSNLNPVKNNLYIPVDPFSGFKVVQSSFNNIDFDVESIKWGTSLISRNQVEYNLFSYNLRSIDSRYSYDILDKINANLKFIDERGNTWFGTNVGLLIKAERDSYFCEIISLGLNFSDVTSIYLDQYSNWWFSDSYFKRTGSLFYKNKYNLNGIKSIMSKWNYDDKELSNFYDTENIFFNNNVNVNSILVDGGLAYLGTMDGVVCYNLLDKKWIENNNLMSFSDKAIWDMEIVGDEIFLATSSGILIMDNDEEMNISIKDSFEKFENIEIYGFEANQENLFITCSAGLFVYTLGGKIDKISDLGFKQIVFSSNQLYGLYNKNIYRIENKQNTIIFRGVHSFDTFNNFFVLNKREKVILVDYLNSMQWEYSSIDGVVGSFIYDVKLAEKQMVFLTNKGISFYEWTSYHEN